MSDWITGREIVAAAKHASAWRTAVALGAGDGVLITSESGFTKAPQYKDDDSLGNPDILETYKMLESLSGPSLSGYLRYESWDVLLAHALGTAGTPTQVESTAYYNTYSPADNIAGKFVTLAMKKSATTHNIWEIPSAKVTGFTISGRVGEFQTISINLMGNKLENQSAVNTSLSSVTYPTKQNLIKFDTRTKFRMNTQSGDALSDSDIIYPMSYEITYQRPHQENFEAMYADASEPVQSGFATATIKLGFDKYSSDTFMDSIAADTEKKMDVLFEGDIIAGSTRYTLRFDLPKIRWQTGEAPVSGPGTIPHNLTGRLLGVSSAPTGMTGVTDPLSMYVVNTRTTDPST